MTPLTDTQSSQMPQRVDSEPADKLFWLSRMEGDLPRASVIPDFRRSAAQRTYRSVPFELDSKVIRVLKSPDITQGVSDVILCTSLVAVLMAQYHRDDELILGLQVAGEKPAVNPLVPFRVKAAPDTTVISVMKAVAGELAAIQGHGLSSLTQMAQLLGTEVSERRYPFFDIGVAVGGADATIDFDVYPVDLAFAFVVTEGQIRGRVLYAADLYDESSIERLVSHFLTAARQVSEHPERPLRGVRVLSPAERSRVVTEFQGRPADFRLDQTLHSLFEEQAHRTPSAVAVIDDRKRLTYAELNDRSNRVAHTLLSLGLTKGDFVGILLTRSCEFLVAMLAVFKAGGAYVPLDPTYPRDRVRYMLDDSEAQFVISDAALIDKFADVVGASNVRVVLSLDGVAASTLLAASKPHITAVGPERIGGAAAHDPALELHGADRAYMIYTSGSSGRPKGAICRHNGALNHLFGEIDGIGIDSAFRFLQTAASSSDISVWQFMAPILFGGATVIADYDVVVDPVRLFAAIRDHRVGIVEPVPVVLRALLDYIAELPRGDRLLPDLRCMMCTGDALASELVDRWLSNYPEIPIANTYGPTETSDDVTLLVMRKPIGDRWAIAPIGPPLPNINVFVVDRDLQPVPVGVPGEICVGGIGVGEGYWRQPDKSREAFVPSPIAEASGGPVYRTGDLGRWLGDGSIEFLGRIDQQVKIRGFRVEPGEIEGTMTQHPAVQDAAVVAITEGTGNKRLVGYFVTRKDQSLSVGELRQFLKGTLAEHMVPAVLVPLGALPLTPLGKLDRKALSRIEYTKDVEHDSFVAPRNATEATFASVWAKVLRVPKVGIRDNFFEIGGDSILTLHLISELRRAGFRLSPKQFFLYPTIAELAAHVAAAQPSEAGSTGGADRAAVTEGFDWAQVRLQLEASFPEAVDVYPLGATQRGIYFQSILASRTSGAYIEQIAFELAGDLSEDAFGKAWQHVVSTTDVLRTAVVRRGTPQPAQVVLRSAALVPDRLDWRPLSSLAQRQEWDTLLSKERMRGFDLKTPPLMRIALIRLAERRWGVVWTYHHIILDGWSEPLILGAVFEAYDALTGKRELAPGPSARYRDFVTWAEAQDMSEAERFWREQLAGFGSPVSIKDNSPAIQPPSNIETSHGSCERSMPEPETRWLEDTARRNRLTIGTLIHGAWALLLHARTGAADAVFGSVVSGRQCNCAGVELIRGLLVVTQPLRTRVAADAPASSWLRLLQLQMAEMREYEHTPLALIQQWCEPLIGKRPLFDSIVVVGNYAGSDLTTLAPTGLEISGVSYATQPLYALTLFLVLGPRLSVRLVYDKRRYAHSTAQQLLDEYFQLLTAIAENPEQRLGGLLPSGAG